MTPIEIKVELLKRGVTLAQIAQGLELTAGHVSQVVWGKRRSAAVEEAVAKAIGKPVARVFPAKAA